jgi:hypothetical protein
VSVTTSGALGQLGKALAAAQGEMNHAAINRDNPYFKSRYADLRAVLDAVRPVLSKHGIAVVQNAVCEPEQVGVTTYLIHASGEFIASTLMFKPTKMDPQGAGSAITYAKRYALAAMCGIASDEDDDGNAASQPQPQPQPVRRETPVKPEADAATKARAEFAATLCDWTGLTSSAKDRDKLKTAAKAVAVFAGLNEVSDNYEKATATVKQLKAEGKRVIEITPNKENA